ncbi:MAG: hypothetical protein LBC41_08195, partial [Clostridiales bacterium]|nr:hypothetical protein [Clostridiales bacterium]
SPETLFDLDDTPTPSATAGKKILVDVRSDIYGLGATLYHILSGKRPDHKATDVVPLSDEEFSTAFVDVINKAMHPNPDMRYQTADEMLDAIKHLRENDPRVRALIRVRNMAAISLLFLFLAGSVTAFVGLRQGEAQQRLIAEQERVEAENQRAEAEKQRIEAENQRVEAENQRLEAEKQQREAELQEALALAAKSATSLQDGDRDNAVVHALSAFPTSENLSQVYVAEAQKSLSDALGVYDLADGFRPHKVVELPSETLQMAISEDGLTGAAVTIGELTIFSTETGTVIDTLETVNSALAELAFVGNDKLVYAGKDGITLYDTALKQTLWTGDLATEIAVSADGSTFASIYLEESFAKVYDASGAKIATIDLSGKKQRVTVNDSFANPNDNMLALSRDGSWLSASFNDGGLALFEISDPENRVDIFEESDFFHFEGGFSGDFFAFSSTGRESSVFAVIDMRYLEQTGGFEGNNPFGVSTSESGVYLSSENIVVKMDPITGEQEEIAFTTSNVVEFAQDGGNAIVSVDDKTFAFFDSAANQTDQYKNGFILDFVDTAKDYAIAGSRSTPRIRISKRETHPSFFEYDTSYLHDEARLNASGTTVMLFSFEGFRLYDINGSIIKELEMPDSKQIYDQQYRRNDKGSYLEVIYNDGKTDMYSGDTGELIGTEQNDAPDLSLYEEFLTDNLKITSPLHGTPVAYSLETGEMIRELETDAYMTYVTQVGEYVITEYVSANSERFGLLLDGTTCETLAYMPNLSDILGERLIFDLGSSGMRETTLKSIPELVALAEGK